MDDRGYAIVMVIIAIALAMILLGVLMSISLLNYKMKATEYQAKDNFYSAEKILDEINVGLRQEVSEAAGAAYVEAMQTYKMSGVDEATRMENFKIDYFDHLRDALDDPVTHDDAHYYIGGAESEYDAATGVYTEGLLSYLDADLIALYRRNATATTNIINVTYDGLATEDSMYSTGEALVLKNLKVTYVDADGYYSEIKTDIEIGYPNISLQESSTIPNVFDYSFIANDKLEVTNTKNVAIKDNIYVGEEGIYLVDAEGTEVTADTQYVVNKGDINLDAQSELTLEGQNVWTKGIVVNGGSLISDTSIYVADDLTVTGKNAVVDLAGNYYGYSSGAGLSNANFSPDNQSAIIVNGSKSNIDLADLQELVLGGNAFIKPAEISVDGMANESVMTGSSLAVKTDQIAFLVPAECIGTSNGLVIVGKNPMTQSDYENWVYLSQQEGTDYKLVDEDKVVTILGETLSGNKTLSDYFDNDYTAHYQTVFQNVKGETICYVYLKMDQDAAAVYYRDYMNAATEQMEEYAEKYQNNIVLDTNYTDISSRGNLITILQNPDSGNCSLRVVSNNLTKNSQELLEIQERQQDYEENYLALCSKLTMNYNGLTETEKTNGSVYKNVINAAELDALTNEKIYRSGDYTAIVAKESISVSNQQVTVDGVLYDKVKLIITAGDVEVTGSFSGLIIAGGTVKLHDTTGAVLESDKEKVTRLLQVSATDGSAKTLVETFFVNGNNYVFDSTGASGSGEGYVNLDGVIAFKNWVKQ